MNWGDIRIKLVKYLLKDISVIKDVSIYGAESIEASKGIIIMGEGRIVGKYKDSFSVFNCEFITNESLSKEVDDE